MVSNLLGEIIDSLFADHGDPEDTFEQVSRKLFAVNSHERETFTRLVQLMVSMFPTFSISNSAKSEYLNFVADRDYRVLDISQQSKQMKSALLNKVFRDYTLPVAPDSQSTFDTTKEQQLYDQFSQSFDNFKTFYEILSARIPVGFGTRSRESRICPIVSVYLPKAVISHFKDQWIPVYTTSDNIFSGFGNYQNVSLDTPTKLVLNNDCLFLRENFGDVYMISKAMFDKIDKNVVSPLLCCNEMTAFILSEVDNSSRGPVLGFKFSGRQIQSLLDQDHVGLPDNQTLDDTLAWTWRRQSFYGDELTPHSRYWFIDEARPGRVVDFTNQDLTSEQICQQMINEIESNRIGRRARP